MEASVTVRIILNSPPLHRHFSSSVLKKLNHRVLKYQICPKLCLSQNPKSPRISNPLGFLNLSNSHNLSVPKQNDDVFSRYKSKHLHTGGHVSVFGDISKSDATVVLLGWLGAKNKHLKRYAEMYKARGVNVITFVVPVSDVLWFDLGKRVEERIKILANELASWVSNEDRCLYFHTFSNTGWLVYGSILNIWQDRQDLMVKIKGCIVDSGGDPELSPQVWAAGFAAALLKKSSSSTYLSAEAAETNKLDCNVGTLKEPPVVETILLSVLEKFFSVLLNLPDVNQRLSRIISTLEKNQPSCPQLYFYSTADKVIPFCSVESFVEDQRRKGRTVRSFNFGSSPHVDHYRTFPDMYSSQLQNFLKECLPPVKQT